MSDDFDFDSAVSALADPAPLTAARAAARLGALGDARAVPPLLERLRAYDPLAAPPGREYLRWEGAAYALGRLGAREAVPVLVPILRHHDELGEHQDPRQAAATALGGIGGEEAQAALTDALFLPNILVQADAARALRRIGTPEALAAVAAWEARTPDWPH